jgi:hypothetical protein
LVLLHAFLHLFFIVAGQRYATQNQPPQTGTANQRFICG